MPEPGAGEVRVAVEACGVCRTDLHVVDGELPEVRGRMVEQGADPAFLGADEFSQFLAGEMPRWAEAVKASGTKMD